MPIGLDPSPERWSPRARRLWWLFAALFVIVVGVNATVNFTAAARQEKSADTGQEILGATLYAKVALVGDEAAGTLKEPALGKSPDELALSSLEDATKAESPSVRARALRRLAILRSFLDRPGVGEALDELEKISAPDRAPAPADEVSLLREVLLGELEDHQVNELASRLTALNLGWFDHLSRERLYRRAGLRVEADAELAEARAAAGWTALALMVFGGAMSLGALLWIVVLFWPKKRAVFERIGKELSSRGELTGAQSVTLLATFVGYMIITPLLWLGVRALPWMATASTGLHAAAVLGGEIAISALAWLLYKAIGRRTGATMRTLGWTSANLLKSVGAGVIGYLLLLPVILIVLLPLALLFEKLGIPSQSHPLVEQLQKGSQDKVALVVLFVVAAVLAPLLEESLFRGALYGSLKSRLGGRAALLVSAFAFAIVHPQVGLGLVGVFVIGVVLTMVYEYTGSLVASATVHALNNGILLAVAVALFAG